MLKAAMKAKRKSKSSKAVKPESDVLVNNPEDMHERIAVEAYLIAEKRGFQDGDPEADWLGAEASVEHLFQARV